MDKKSNHFKGFQEEKIALRLQLINEVLTVYKKQKVSFKNITELATAVSKHIAKNEGAACSASTILRNEKYKGLIEAFYNSLPNSKKKADAGSFIAELTQSNVERENMRLKLYIAQLEKELDEYRNGKAAAKKEVVPYLSNDEQQVAHLSKALHLLIQHFEGLVAINEKGDLVDLTKKVNNVIVEKVL